MNPDDYTSLCKGENAFVQHLILHLLLPSFRTVAGENMRTNTYDIDGLFTDILLSSLR